VRCDEVTVEHHEKPAFFDPGENWSGVSCPACAASMEEAWPAAMGLWHETGDLHFTAGCCNTRTNLNDLVYGSPCGFARFAISAMNPERPLTHVLGALERLLGTRLRVVRQHV
jgi:hypothetical protein